MCGIIGYTGSENAEKIIIKGLYSLEYRGYDSAGLSISTDSGIKTVKCSGRVSSLEAQVSSVPGLDGKCGVGHTRWATHGAPSAENAHPHESDTLTLVHNGIIENYTELRKRLILLGYVFKSETDTECAAHIIDFYYKKSKNPITAISAAVSELRGSYALGIIFRDSPDEIYAVRKDNPLIVAESADGCFISSDIPAVLPYTKKICRLGENEIVRLTSDSALFYDLDGNSIEHTFDNTEWGVSEAKKDGYPHFMLKEIHEQPEAIRRAAAHRLNSDGLPYFTSDGIPDSFLENIDIISVIGCGSAVHAGYVGKTMIEALAGIPVTVDIASEYRYAPPVMKGNVLTVCISQSGETADTIAALRSAVQRGFGTLGIINVVGSTIASECDYVMYTNAGPEIAVATTKGYTTQVTVLAMLAAKLALIRGTKTEDEIRSFCSSLVADIPSAISSVISKMKEISTIAERIRTCEDVFFIGRGADNYAALECSLKLKEISYIHCESYAAGELKHGTLSLVTDGTPVFAIATDKKYYEKTTGNIREVRSRGGYVILVCGESAEYPETFGNIVFKIPDVPALLSPLVSVVFAQCLAYQTSCLRGCDVDHPRNLAKSVTVE